MGVSFFKKRKSIFGGLPFFCNFVRNTIYVLEIEMLEPVVLASYVIIHTPPFPLIHSINQYHNVI